MTSLPVVAQGEAVQENGVLVTAVGLLANAPICCGVWFTDVSPTTGRVPGKSPLQGAFLCPFNTDPLRQC